MNFFNAVLEDFKWQCDGRWYTFKKQAVTEIPDNISMFIEDQCAHRGIVALRYGQDFKEGIRHARIKYVKECLEPRISMVNAHKYDMKLRGVDLNDTPEWKRWLRWRDELYRLLEIERPLEEEFSFLSKEERTKLGITDERIEEFKQVVPQDVFKNIEQARKVEVHQVRTDSFSELRDVSTDLLPPDDEGLALEASRKEVVQQPNA